MSKVTVPMMFVHFLNLLQWIIWVELSCFVSKMLLQKKGLKNELVLYMHGYVSACDYNILSAKDKGQTCIIHLKLQKKKKKICWFDNFVKIVK